MSATMCPSAVRQLWLYRSSEPGLWTVGHYDANGRWQPESDHNSAERAARRVHWLNGGAQAPGREEIVIEVDRLQALVDRLETSSTRWESQARRCARRVRELQRRGSRR